MAKSRDIRGIFITATGTDLGKTYVSALLVKLLRENALNCGYYKPALSGLSSEIVSDVEYVSEISGAKFTIEENVSYSFRDAVSPHLASDRAGVRISLDKIIKDYAKLSNKYSYIVVEGAGGITCPFDLKDKKLLLPDVIKALNLGIILIADGGLGTINSTLLTCEYAKVQGLNVKGIILNNFDVTNFMHQDNLTQVERLTGVKVIATVPKDATELDIDLDIVKGLFD
ncbi:dethiobiotin synthase [bacterium]|nr:dethiobiotin synthase [bacterium]